MHNRIGEIIGVAAMCGVNIVCFQETWSELFYGSHNIHISHLLRNYYSYFKNTDPVTFVKLHHQ